MTKHRALLLAALLATNCGPGATAGDGGMSETGTMQGPITNARAIAAGQSLMLDVACVATIYVGPFQFMSEGDTVRLNTSLLSPTGAQSCGLGGSWVDSASMFLSTSGVGCAEGMMPTTTQLMYSYTPGAGGNNANPVYLKLDRNDQPGCPQLRLTISRP